MTPRKEYLIQLYLKRGTVQSINAAHIDFSFQLFSNTYNVPPEKLEELRKRYTVEQLSEKLIPLIDEQFTEEELWEIIQFYSSPAGQKIMVTAHDAFRYMGRAYGIEVIGIQGLSTESEAGLKDINRIVDTLVERKIPAVFVESSVSDKNVKALLEGANSRGQKVIIGGELFSDAMGKSGTYEGTYIGMIDHNATTIARALGGQAPARGMNGKLSKVH